MKSLTIEQRRDICSCYYYPVDIPSKKLNNGLYIPSIGFGTWMMSDGQEAESAVSAALEAGYRHIDTAAIYRNEKSVGRAIKNSGLRREELFITTKLWNDDQFYDDVLPAFEKSLENLQLDYIDLYLVHFPVTETRDAAWLKMEEIYKNGKAKSIGVSNYTERHLEQLLKSCSVKPAVNQVEVHTFLHQKELRSFCKEHGIAVEAYSPLAHGSNMDNYLIKQLAEKYSKTYGQIMLRWIVQNDMIVLPKSAKKHRIEENIQIFDFEISQDDMKKIDELDWGLRTCWNPVNVP